MAATAATTKQKVSRQNSAQNQQQSAANNSSVHHHHHIANSSAAATAAQPVRLETEEYTPVFYDEISDIMRGFGDCDQPLRTTVNLVDKILLQQLRGILQDAIESAVERKTEPKPSLKDFYKILRKNPVKMYRLQKHIKDLKDKRLKYQLLLQLEGRSIGMYQDELDTDGQHSDDDVDRSITEKYDEEKLRRLFRADRISQTLNGIQYKEFNEARRTSFYCRNSNAIRTKLRQWLKTDYRLSNQVFTILSYFAHETIATIVDYCILTRLDSSNRQTEPYGRVTTSGKQNCRCVAAGASAPQPYDKLEIVLQVHRIICYIRVRK